MAERKKLRRQDQDKSRDLFQYLAGAHVQLKLLMVFDLLTTASSDKHTEGPLSLLRDAFLKQFRLVVHIRRVVDMRGTCVGTLVGFDKHFNLVRRRCTLAPLHSHSPTIVPLCSDYAECRRRILTLLSSGATSDGNRRHHRQYSCSKRHDAQIGQETPHQSIGVYQRRHNCGSVTIPRIILGMPSFFACLSNFS